MIHELDILNGLVHGEFSPHDPVRQAAKPLQGEVTLADPITKVETVFDADNIAIVVDGKTITGVISKIDVIQYLSARA